MIDSALDAVAIADAVRGGRTTALEVVEACLAVIDRGNPDLNAFVVVDAPGAREAALLVDRAIANGLDPGPFAGVPFGVKDLEDCVGMPTSHGSLWFKGGPAARNDSIHVSRIRASGGVPVGKTAAAEFGMDSATATKAWGVTRNPRRPDCTPGGSSGGSAAAVAAGFVPMATGSDGGGSIRSPAAFCGLVGLKPSLGRIATQNAAASGLSCPGVLVQTVRDCARHLDVACGPDARDRLSLPTPRRRYEALLTELDVHGLRAAWSSDLGFAPVESGVRDLAFEAADEVVRSAELEWVRTPLLSFPDVVEVWLDTVAVDLWSGIEEGMWPQRSSELCDLTVRVFEELGIRSSRQLAAAHRQRESVQQRTAELFSVVDVVFTPTVAVSGFRAEGPLPLEVEGRSTPHGPELFTMWANLTGLPAISVPAGVCSASLPVGLQIVAGQHREDVLLRLARELESVRPWPTSPVAGLGRARLGLSDRESRLARPVAW